MCSDQKWPKTIFLLFIAFHSIVSSFCRILSKLKVGKLISLSLLWCQWTLFYENNASKRNFDNLQYNLRNLNNLHFFPLYVVILVINKISWMTRQLTSWNFIDSPFKYDVFVFSIKISQLCVTLNNIEYMRLWLSKLPEKLGWEDVINALITAHGERGGKHARSALENMLCSADDDMLNKVADAIEHIGQRVRIQWFILTLY